MTGFLFSILGVSNSRTVLPIPNLEFKENLADSLRNLPKELVYKIFEDLEAVDQESKKEELKTKSVLRKQDQVELGQKYELKRLRLVDKNLNQLVQALLIDPEYAKYKIEIDSARKIERFFIKFKDRPIWQKIGLIGVGVLFSPLILLFRGPKILKATYIYLKRQKKVFQKYVRIFNDKVLKPIVESIFKTLKFTYDKILTPAGRAVQSVAKSIYNRIVIPISQELSRAAKFSYRTVLTPIGKAIQAVAKVIFIKFPKQIYIHVLTPLGHGFVNVSKFVYHYVLTPLGRGISKVANFSYTEILNPLAKKIYTRVLTPLGYGIAKVAKFTYTKILKPLAKIIYQLAKGILVTLPKKIYAYVLTPVGHGIATLSQVIYRNVLTPIGHGISFGAKIIYLNVAAPIVRAIQSVVKYILTVLPLLINKVVIVPVSLVATQLKDLVAATVYTAGKLFFGW